MSGRRETEAKYADAAQRDLGARLRVLRENASLTQAEVARRVGCSQALVSDAEKGTYRTKIQIAAAITKACDYTMRIEFERNRT